MQKSAKLFSCQVRKSEVIGKPVNRRAGEIRFWNPLDELQQYCVRFICWPRGCAVRKRTEAMYLKKVRPACTALLTENIFGPAKHALRK